MLSKFPNSDSRVLADMVSGDQYNIYTIDILNKLNSTIQDNI